MQSVPKEITTIFDNGSKNFCEQEFDGRFTCLGENSEKHITFSVLIKKEVTRIGKSGEEITKFIPYILKFINSARFMASSLSNLVKIPDEEIDKIKC